MDSLNAFQEPVISVEDKFGIKLPLQGLSSLLEVFLQLGLVFLIRVLEQSQDPECSVHLLYRLLHLSLEDVCRLQVVPCLKWPSLLAACPNFKISTMHYALALLCY